MYIDKKLLNLWQECNPSYFILVSCEKKEQYVQNKETELCPLVVQYKPQKKKSLKNYSKSKEKKKYKDMCGYILEKGHNSGRPYMPRS